jgi:hypothetical protein
MECVVAVEFLYATNGEMVAKEVAIVSKTVMQTHHFKSPHPNYYYHSGSEGMVLTGTTVLLTTVSFLHT